jgi:penicillin-binding protein 2
MNLFDPEDIEQIDQREITNNRLHLLFVLVFLLLSGLLLRLSYLQLTEGQSFRIHANESHLDEMPISAPRGFIYDRNMNLLVSDTQSYTLMYSGTSSDKKDLKLIQLANNIHTVIPKLDRNEIMDRLTDSMSVTHRVYAGLTEQQVSYIREHQRDFEGCNIIIEPQRHYDKGDLAGHVIGYLNSIPPKKADYFKKQGYQPDTKVGWAGVEMQYESYLHGTDGKIKVQVDSQYHVINNYGMDPPPVKGDDLVLNIDSGLQQTMQDVLKNQVELLKMKGKPAKEAAAVAMNPYTGEVLGMASYPNFNPQWLIDGVNKHADEFEASQNNYALQAAFPPGSTQKPLTAMAALQDRVIDPWTSIHDSGSFSWDNWTWKDWTTAGHGTVNVTRALEVSCDTFFYNLAYWYAKGSDGPKAHKYVMDRLRFYEAAFGLGPDGTGIDLPYEAENHLFDNGNPGDLLFASMGQDEAYSPIALAQYVSTIANGGKRMEPHVVKQILDPQGHVVQEIQPKVLNTVPVSAENIRIVQQGMKQVVSSPEGTGYSIFRGANYTVAGKTGTAEVGTIPNNNDTSVWIGYAPADHPQIALSIVVPVGGHSSDSIGPIARKIYDYYFNQMAKK